jgi:histidinol-phosphate phosphatase family protein
MKPAIFLDKDGTLLADLPYNVDPQRMTWATGARAAVGLLGRLGHPLIVVSNQSGVALGHFDETALRAVHDQLKVMFHREGARLAGFYYCPHHPRGTRSDYAVSCLCRKPMPGMLIRAAADHGVDLKASWFVGDILDDVEAGARAGCRTVLLANGNETEWLRSPLREPDDVAADLYAAARHIARQLPPARAAGGKEAA